MSSSASDGAREEAPRAACTAVIPVFNLGPFVGDAIESVLAQRVSPGRLRVIVVDDGSTDESSMVIRQYTPAVEHLRRDNGGPSAARNSGLRAVTTPFTLLLDGDDRLLPDFLPTALALLETHPEVDVVHSGVRCIDDTGAPLPSHGYARLEGDVLLRLVLGNPLLGPTTVFRTAVAARVGGFDETLRGVEDWDFWLRLSCLGAQWACIDRPLVEYRIRGQGLHGDPEMMAANRVRLLDKLFDDSALRPDARALRAAAYQNVYLANACEHMTRHARQAAGDWFRRAVEVAPEALREARFTRRMCRLLLPVGLQSEGAVLAHRRLLLATVRRMLQALFAVPGLDPHIRRLRTATWGSYLRTVLRLEQRAALTRLRAAVAGPPAMP